MQDIFAHNALSVSEFCTDKVLSPSPWATILICTALLLFTLIIIPFRRKLSLLSRSLFSQRHFSLMIRESKILEERVFIFTLLFDILVASTGVLIILQHFHSPLVEKLTPMGLFGLLFAGLLLLYWFKFFCNFIYSKLFEHPKDLYFINLYKFAFLTDAATVLFCFLIVVEFTGMFAILYGYIPVFVTFFAVYVYKLLKINPRNINLFNFFIYFCTLEILPYVLLVKLNAII